MLYLYLSYSLVQYVFCSKASNRLVKEVGNAAKETDLTFAYKPKDPKKKTDQKSIPFQVGSSSRE